MLRHPHCYDSQLASLFPLLSSTIFFHQDVPLDHVVMPVFTVRVVTCSEKFLLTLPEFYERYKGLGYPSQFNFRWGNICPY